MSEAKFYDAHCHIMNLSQPNLLAFIQRLNLPFILLFTPLLPFLLKRNYNKIKNLLSVMENDLGTLLLMMERFLVEDQTLCENGSFKIGGNFYSKVVLTPLLMDFGYKGRTDSNTYYNLPSQKPIAEQVCDLFNGIRKLPRRVRNICLRFTHFSASTPATIFSITKPAKEFLKGPTWNNYPKSCVSK